jgi:methylated-DNA-[protein]-cysteine S-methyltransferase
MSADRNPRLAHRVVPSPIGALDLWAGPAGLRAVLWPGEDGSRVARSLGSVAADDPSDDLDTSGAQSPAVKDPTAEAHLDRAETQLAEYFRGTRREFDLDLDMAGTAFQRSAWEVLRTIPYGATLSYGQQAAALGDPAKARAVGAANGRNPLSIVVPCHRVVAAGGALTGFAGGLDTKAWLLDHERRVLDDEHQMLDHERQVLDGERRVPTEAAAGEVRASSGR